MIHVANSAQLIQIANNADANGVSPDDEVWRGDDGSFVIGDMMGEESDTPYVLAGTLDEYATAED